MNSYKSIDSESFTVLPLCILRDDMQNGERREVVKLNDVFQPNGKIMLKSVSDAYSPAHAFTRYHFHEGIEILRINRGEAAVVLNNRTLDVRENDIVIVNPFGAHGIFLSDLSAEFSRTCIMFQPLYLFPGESGPNNRFFADLRSIRFQSFIPSSHPCSAALRRCIDSMVELCLQGTRGWHFAVYSNLIMFYSHIIRGDLRSESAGNPPYQFEFMSKVTEYIEKNLDQDISTTDVAAYCLYSTEHFCRLFKRCFYKTFKDYLNLYRIQKAKDYIEMGNHTTVATLAAMFGFNNQNHFSHMFKKYTGVLPSEYINTTQGNLRKNG